MSQEIIKDLILTKEQLVKKIEEIEGVIRVYQTTEPLNLLSGETSLQLIIYYPTPGKEEK